MPQVPAAKDTDVHKSSFQKKRDLKGRRLGFWKINLFVVELKTMSYIECGNIGTYEFEISYSLLLARV